MTGADAFEAGALRGRRIIVTRSAGQASALVERLQVLGADVVACPTIAIRPPEQVVPLDEAMRKLTEVDWVVFTSANAVDSVAERLLQSGGTPGALGLVRVAAVGAATRRALHRRGVAANLIPHDSHLPRSSRRWATCVTSVCFSRDPTSPMPCCQTHCARVVRAYTR